MPFNRTYFLYIRKATGKLMNSLLDSTQPNTPGFVALDDFTLAIYFCDEPAAPGAAFTASAINAGDQIVAAGRPQSNLSEASLLFSANPFTQCVDGGGNYYYTAQLNLNTTQLVADMPSEAVSNVLNAFLEIQVQNAANTQRQSFIFALQIMAQVYSGTEGVPVSGEPAYPAPGAIALVASTLQWLSGITGLTGGGTNIDAIPTAGVLAVGYAFAARLAGQMKAFVLCAGAAGAGQIAPLDYNAGSNAVHWEEME